VNSSPAEKATCFAFEGVKKLAVQALVTVLTGESLEKMNSLDLPLAISPVTQPMAVKGKKINISLKPNSLTVIRVAMK
jgi:alpha-L-arabinofuranosidase